MNPTSVLRRLTVASAALSAVGVSACDRSPTGTAKPLPSPSPPASASAVAASSSITPAASAIASGDQLPSFGRDIAPVLERTCTQADHCHGSLPAEAIDMDLRPAAAYEALVGAPAQARHGALRVAPGKVRASFLITKLVGPLKHGEGKLMPLDPDTGIPAQPNPLPRDFIERVVKPWIEAGAPND